MQYGNSHYLYILAILTIVLVVMHYTSPLLKRIPYLKPAVITSFASGIAVSYVFLHMLPALIESRDQIHKLLSQSTHMSTFKDLIVFIAALIGFEIFYFSERLAYGDIKSHAKFYRRNYRIHLTLYFVYNFLITYTLLIHIEASVTYAIIFTITMSLHFVLTDNHFKRQFHQYFTQYDRFILVGGLILGSLFSVILYPVKIFITAILTALLGGAVLYNAFVEEITLSRQTSIIAFLIGTVVVGLLLSFLLIKP